MGSSRPPRDPGIFKNILGSLVACFAVLVFGAMNIEFRIMLTALVFFAVSFVGWILWTFRLIRRERHFQAQVAVFPVMIVVWMIVGAAEQMRERTVVPTPEYSENHPRQLYTDDERSVVLLEKSAFALSGDFPRIDGATSLYELYSSFARTVAGDSWYPGGLVDCSRTPEAYERLIFGDPYGGRRWGERGPRADMIFVFRPSRRQIEDAAAAGAELRITPIGYDAFVFFVNAANPVDSLTVGQLRDIYSGRATNWKAVGGSGGRILPYQRYEGSGSQGAMERFMEDDALMEPEREHRFRFMRGIIAHTARYRNLESAIGYSFLYYVETMLKGGGVKLLAVDGTLPLKETVLDGSYPLVEEICVVTAGTANPNVRAFVDWILSPQGQAMVEAIGYIPVNPAAPGRPFPATRVDE